MSVPLGMLLLISLDLALGTSLARAGTDGVSTPVPLPWHDPSSHRVRFVTVDKSVTLEVLDWGGSGRSVVLLAGLGDTAHVFDDFAPKLTSEYHVYGITRRGFGASSAPAVGGSSFAADRLGDDVLTVLDVLRIERPVLVGHSIAGEELSSVATRYPSRVAGLVYLDAAYPYAYYSRSAGIENVAIDTTTLQRALASLSGFAPGYNSLVSELLDEDLPAIESDLRELRLAPESVTLRPDPPAPTAEDRLSCQAWRARELRQNGYVLPVAECHQIHVITSEGHVGDLRARPETTRAVVAGERKYTNIRVPILAIFALPHDPGAFYHSNRPALAAWEARDLQATGAVVDAFEKGNPSARVVVLPRASHYVFLTNQADVLRAMRSFLDSLPREG
jgi:non-heme chloroperoxidase